MRIVSYTVEAGEAAIFPRGRAGSRGQHRGDGAPSTSASGNGIQAQRTLYSPNAIDLGYFASKEP